MRPNQFLPFWAAVCCLLFSQKTFAQTCTGNLLQNPGFESGLTNWEGGGQIDAAAHSGTKALKNCAVGTAIRQTLAATAGKTYTLNGFLKKDATANMFVFMKFMSASWQPLENPYANWLQQGTSWSAFEPLVKTAPTGTAWVEISVVQNGGTGCVFADDLCLTESGAGGGQPDLAYGSVNFPQSLPAGNSANASVTVINSGNANSTANFSVRAVLSTVAVPVAPFNFVGSVNFQGIAAGANSTATGLVSIPANTPAGNYFIVFIIDQAGQIAESNESNNNLPVPISITGTGGAQPDLTISNLQLNAYQTQVGKVFSYRFDLANQSSTAIPGNFTVKAYLSTDDILSSDDVQDGTVTTGNFAAGLTVQQVLGATTVPASLSPGNYLIILKVDADGQVAESNEANNTVVSSSPLQVVAASNGTAGICEKFVGNGQLVCAQPVTGSTNAQITLDGGGQRTRTTMSAIPAVVSNTNLGAISNNYYQPYTISVNGTAVSFSKNNIDGTVAYTKTLPAASANALAQFHSVTEFGTGFVLMGSKNAVGNQPFFIDSIFAIKTDANLNVVLKKYIGPGNGQPYGAGAGSLTQIGPDRLAYIFSTSAFSFNYSANLRVMDGNFVQKSDKSLYQNIWSAGAGLRVNPCRGFTVTDSQGLGYCKSGGCYRQESFDGEFVNDQFVAYNFSTVHHQTQLGNGIENYDFFTTTTDGGSIKGERYLSGNIYQNTNDTIVLKKYNAANALLWTKKVKIPEASFVRKIIESGGEVYFLKQNQSYDWSVLTLSCLENVPQPTLPDLTVAALTMGNGSIAQGAAGVAVFTAQNIGTAQAAPHKYALYLSSNTNWDAFDVLLGSTTLNNPLAAGASGQLVISFTIPPQTAVGSNYFLIAKADSDLQVAEANESNNEQAIALTVTAPNLPNFIIQGGVNPTATAGGPALDATTIISVPTGTPYLGLIYGRFYLSTDNVFSADDVVLQTLGWSTTLPVVQIGTTISYSLSVPAGTAAGSYFFIFRLDPDNLVAESNENDNTLTFPVTVSAGPTTGGCNQNLLQNGGFENDLTGWEGATVVSATASAGAKSAKICAGQNLRQTLPTTAGKNLTMTFNARGETSTTAVLAYIKYLSSSWQPLVTEFFNYSATTTFGAATLSKTAPAGAVWVEIGFLKQSAGCVLVDEICLSENGGGSIDLAILGSPNNVPGGTVGSNLPVTFNLYNTTTVTASNVKITVSLVSGLAYQTTPFAATIGTFSTTTHEWTIPSLPPGTYPFTLNYINQTAAAKAVFANLTSSTPADTNPSNNNGVVQIGAGTGGNPCSPDVTPPQISCPTNISYVLVGNLFQATWTEPVPTDNCSTPVLVNENPSQHSPGSYFPLGKTTVVYRATDGAGNSATCSFIVEPPASCLLLNPGFENNLSNWEGSGGMISATASAGAKSLKLCQNGTIRQTIATSAGKNLTLLFKARTETTGANKILSYIKYLSSSWQPLATEFFDFNTTAVFSQGTVSKTAPTGTAWVEIGFTKQTSGCVLVDEVCLSEGSGSGGQKPDLTVQDFTFQNGPTYAVGATIQVTPFIRNNGPASFNVGGTEIARFYLSTDAILDAGDFSLNGFWHPQTTIAAGATISELMNVTMATSAPTGSLFMICVTDYPQLVDENNETNNYLAKPITITGGTNCNITTVTGPIVCEDNGTPTNPTDDTFGAAITVSNTGNCGTGWTSNSTPASGSFGTTPGFGPFLITAGNKTLTFTAQGDPTKTATVTLVAPPTCSNGSGGTGADLKIAITADKTTVPQWGNVTYTVTAKNEGTAPISNAEIAIRICKGDQIPHLFLADEKLVYAGQPTQPTKGNYNYLNQFWTLTNLAPGESGVLTLKLFTLSTAEKKVFAYSDAQTPTDPDSQPSGSDFPPVSCLATQDDEAVWTINLGQSALAVTPQSSGEVLDKPADFALFPNPTDGFATLNLGQFFGKNISVSATDAFGKTVFSQKLDEVKEPYFDLDFSEKSNGVYFIKIESDGWRPVVKRLIISKL